MSREILEALMQLFAIISRPESNASERRLVVESFLNRQLNHEMLAIYLDIFNTHFARVMEEDAKVSKKERVLAKRSVKVLKICTEINRELAQSQKVIVLFQMLEFIKSEREAATDQEMEFIAMVADTFHIPQDDYILIRNFVLSDTDLEDKASYLVVDNKQEASKDQQTKHIYRKDLQGQIRFIEVQSTKLYFLKYMGKAELYMNGQLLEPQKSYPLNSGSSIRNQQIRPVYYSDIVSLFVGDKVKSKIIFEADSITHQFKSGAAGLNDVGFTERSGRLVGIMGASGAGKSTLLNVLNGVTKPTEGKVMINGIDIHTNDPGTKGIIGYVSQDDLLIEELSVYQNLYYNARLCFDNYSRDQLNAAVDLVLKNLGLYEIKDIQVGTPLNKKISGGQRKRLNIALELIREPAVLFLDEPTSGLSSRDSENILDLLKELTFKGKLVFVVIHQPSSDIFKMFDSLLIMDKGGYLIYKGDPVDSIEYFKSRVQAADWNESECPTCGNVTPEQIFNIVETNVLDEFGQLTQTRRISPAKWSEYFRKDRKKTKKVPASREDLPAISFKIPGKLKQYMIFLKRDILKKLSDAQYLVFNFAEAPILALLLAGIVRYYDLDVSNIFGYTLAENTNMPVYIFMSVIVALFMGLTVSAEEIIKDRKILKREAFLNLSRSAYLLSKLGVQFKISAIQALTFVLVGNTIMGIKGMYFEYWVVLFSAWAAANVMGLLISDSFKTVVTIYILIPFLVIPQIILSGILVKYENLNPQISSPEKIPWYGEVITARWAYEGLATYQFMNNDYQVNFYEKTKLQSIGNLKANFHIVGLLNKIDFVERNMNRPEAAAEMTYSLEVLRNEIQTEYRERMILKSYHPETPGFSMKYRDQLYPQLINQEMIAYTREYLETLQVFYRETFRKARGEIDDVKRSYGTEALLELQRRFNNETLEEFVTNSKSLKYYSEYKRKAKMIQKRDPIYQDPTHPFIKAHFYAPRKMFAGVFYPTLWVNVAVIWLMTLITYLLLYIRALKILLDLFEGSAPRKS